MDERSLYRNNNNNNDIDPKIITSRLFFAAKEGDIDRVILLLKNKALKINDGFPVQLGDPQTSISETIMSLINPFGTLKNLSKNRSHLQR